jgi:hypothetical protein
MTISYFVFAITNDWLDDLSIKEYRICIEAKKVKTTSEIYITEKGVCVQQRVCEKFNDIFECENVNNKSVNKYNFRIVKNLNKDNFDFEVLNKPKEIRYFNFIKTKINGNEKGFIFGTNEIYLKMENVDLPTFQYLGGKYSKDKNHVYYKSEIISADSETFIYEKRTGKVTGRGKDKNGVWIKGVLQK